MNRLAGSRKPPTIHGPRYAPLVVVLTAVCIGIAWDRLRPGDARIWWWTSLAAWCVWLAAVGLRRRRMASVVLCLSFLAMGGAWHHAWWHLYPRHDIYGLIGDEFRPVTLEAIAIQAPRRVPAPPFDPLRAVQVGERSRMLLQVSQVRNAQRWRPASGTASVMIEGVLEGVQAGDRVRIAGAIRRPTPPLNPGDVDFAAYARSERRLSFLLVSFPEAVTVVTPGSAWNWRRWLDTLRHGGDRLLWQHIARERAGLASALLLGAREQLDVQRTAAFLRTNTIHILAISGMHVAILAGCLFYALRFGLTPRRWTLAAIALATILYTVLTDSPPSAVRAMILVLLVCLAMMSGRPAAAFNCWAAGGLVVLALNPTDLFRLGPQLSFLAVAAMAWVGPRWSNWKQPDPLQRLIQQSRPWPQRAARQFGQSLWRGTVVSAVIWLVTVPLIAARFHVVSPAGLVLTTVLAIPTTFALMSGFATMLLGSVAPPIGCFFGAICDGSLWVIDTTVAWANRLPGSYFWLSGPDEWWIIGFHVLLALVVVKPGWPWPHYGRLAGIWLVLGMALAAASYQQPRHCQCTFLSVGHGTSVLIRTPDEKTVLYDAGTLGSPAAGARSIAGALWAEGIMRLDAIVISHADIDHYNALPELLGQFQVDAVYVSPVMFREDIEPLRVLRKAIASSGAQLHEISAGDPLPFSGALTISVLHPPSAGVRGNDNAQSIVLAVECLGRRVLLTGDLEAAGTDALLRQPPWDCDIALAPHHGSPRSNPPGFSGWCHPEFVVISGGHSSDSGGRVASTYESAGARVFHTAHDGAVRFRLNADEINVSRWRNGSWETPP